MIQKINEKYKGNFTQADIVVMTTLHDKLMGDDKLNTLVKTTDHQIFRESIFPKIFDNAAQESYIESTETFTSLFENKEKYNAMMYALADILYKGYTQEMT